MACNVCCCPCATVEVISCLKGVLMLPQKAFWWRNSPVQECCSKSSVEELEAPSSRPKRKAAINAVGFSKAILVKSDSDTETDDDMYGQHHAKRRRQTPLVKANVVSIHWSVTGHQNLQPWKVSAKLRTSGLKSRPKKGAYEDSQKWLYFTEKQDADHPMKVKADLSPLSVCCWSHKGLAQLQFWFKYLQLTISLCVDSERYNISQKWSRACPARILTRGVETLGRH